MAFDAHPGTGRGDLPRGVRLHDATADDAIGPGPDGGGEPEFQFADFVSAKAEPGAIVPLHPELFKAELSPETRHPLHRRGQMGERQARKPSKRRERIDHRRMGLRAVMRRHKVSHEMR